MPNNPVQVVLNTENFIGHPDKPRGGSVKDFFASRDPEFRAHKQRLLGELDDLRDRIDQRPDLGIEYAHVVLQGDAWAKTKRPTETVLRPDVVPLVGGGRLGELLVEFTAENLPAVRRAVEEAEDVVSWGLDRNGVEVPKPTRKRGEVGAIEAIRPHNATDRRRFSAQEAVDWLSDPRTGGLYIIETFADIIEFGGNETKRPRAKAALHSFLESLSGIGLPLERVPLPDSWRGQRVMCVRLDDKSESSTEGRVALHQRLLEFLDQQAAVRRVLLPPLIEAGHAVQAGANTAAPATVEGPRVATEYAIVGIVDTGVAAIPALETWCAGRTSVVASTNQDRSHGTFIAGLTAVGSQLNSHPLFQELSCKFFDLAMYPTNSTDFPAYYPNGFLDFLQQLDVEVVAAKASGARVFNMSLALERQVSDDSYGVFAAIVDRIADDHDILLVLPAGNLASGVWRPEWPNTPNEVLKMLAEYRHAGTDRILQPAESVRSIVVGAVNPPTCASAALLPAVYTRRGPSAALGSKPDVAHVGGRGAATHDLVSLDVGGFAVHGCGTSYAAPLVSRSLANLDRGIEGDVSRETLIALLAHHSLVPDGLCEKELERISRDFVGFGIPALSAEMLETDDNTITLLFNSVLEANEELEFKFAWPAALVSEHGQCRGRVRATLAYRPPIDAKFDAEFVRINMDVHLRQEKIDVATGDVSWEGQLRSATDKRYERQLIEHGQKWWPVKRYERKLRGVGASSQWKLVVDSLTRAASTFPDEGVPFSVLLTISDAAGKQDVFREMRQQLLAGGVTIADVRTATRVVTRA